MTEKAKAYRRAYYARKRDEEKRTRAEGKCPRCKKTLTGRDRAFVKCAECREIAYLGKGGRQ